MFYDFAPWQADRRGAAEQKQAATKAWPAIIAAACAKRWEASHEHPNTLGPMTVEKLVTMLLEDVAGAMR